jgi:hypothetical protein
MRGCQPVAFAMLAPWAARADAQGLASGFAPEVSIVRTIAALALCLIAALAVALTLRRRRTGHAAAHPGLRGFGWTGRSRIEVVEARRVSPHADVCMIRVDGAEYLMLCGASGFELRAWSAGEAAAGDARG